MLLRSCCKFLAVQCDFWGESSLFFLLNVASLPGSSSVFLCARYTWEEFSTFYTGKWPGFRIVRPKTIQSLDSFHLFSHNYWPRWGIVINPLVQIQKKTVMLWHCGMDELSPQSDETCHRFPIKKTHLGVYNPIFQQTQWLAPAEKKSVKHDFWKEVLAMRTYLSMQRYDTISRCHSIRVFSTNAWRRASLSIAWICSGHSPKKESTWMHMDHICISQSQLTLNR